MAEGQTIVENGRVSVLFKSLMSIAAALITAGILAVFAMSWQLTQSVAELDKTISLLSNDYKHSMTDNVRRDNDITALDRRIAELERQRRTRDSDDNR